MSAPKTIVDTPAAGEAPAAAAEILYRFPYSRTVLEMMPDYHDTLQVRLAWQKGKTLVPLLETTPLRPAGTVLLAGETFALTLSRHERKKRDRIYVRGERHAGRAKSARLRCDLFVEGREDRLVWEWQVRARGGAAAAATARADVRLALPLSPGRAEFLTLPKAARTGVAVWRDGLALTAVLGEQQQEETAPRLVAGPENGLCIVWAGAPVGARNGARVRLELRVTPAAARGDAQEALMRHLADAADRAQAPLLAGGEDASLHDLADRSARALMAQNVADNRGLDRLLLRIAPDRHGCGEDADAALVAHALLQRFHLTGREEEKRRAFLLARGVCEFQVVDEDAPHRGAFWDTLGSQGRWEDAAGGRTLGIVTAARATLGLNHLHAAFGQDVMSRTALAGAQWLLLRQDVADGCFAASRYHENGPPVENGSPWVFVHALRPLVETFRQTRNEVFLKAALRAVLRGLIEGLADSGSLSPADACCADIAEAVEGVLAVSRESENAAMITLAKRLGGVLRARRNAHGIVLENGVPSVPASLAACHAALALARVDDDPAWPLFALRGLRAVAAMTSGGANASLLRPADHGALLTLPAHLLLTLAARAPGGVADLDALTLSRAGWQTFAPDPTTREFLRVEPAQENGEAVLVDHLALVCPFNLQVLVAVCAPPTIGAVRIVKNGRAPYLKNLVTGDYGTDAVLVSLGDGRDANVGVFLADT